MIPLTGRLGKVLSVSSVGKVLSATMLTPSTAGRAPWPLDRKAALIALGAFGALGAWIAGLSLPLAVAFLLIWLWVARRFTRGPRRRRTRLKITGSGHAFLGLTLAVGFAAINTGNNLLYLLLGMQLSMIVMSGVLSEVILRGLEMRRQIPSEIYAGVPFLTGVVLTNRKRRVPAFSLEVEDVFAGQQAMKKCFFLKVPAGGTLQTSYRGECPRRGVQPITHCVISTRFPFGFFRKSKTLPVADELLVLPAPYPVDHLIRALAGLDGHQSQPHRGQGQEFHGLRQHQEGDDARAIYWKRSARTGRLVIREQAADHSREIALYVNTALPPGGAPPEGAGADELGDAVAALAASALRHLQQTGCAVSVILDGQTFAASDRRGALMALRALALMSMIPGGQPPRPGAAPSAAKDQRHRLLITHPLAASAPGRFDGVLTAGGAPAHLKGA